MRQWWEKCIFITVSMDWGMMELEIPSAAGKLLIQKTDAYNISLMRTPSILVMEVKLVVYGMTGMHPFLDGAVDLIKIFNVFAFGDGVEPNLKEDQCATGYSKLTVHPQFLDE